MIEHDQNYDNNEYYPVSLTKNYIFSYKKSKQPTLSESLCKGLCYYRLVQGFRVAGLFAGQYCLICIKY